MIRHIQRWIKASVVKHFHDSVLAVKGDVGEAFSFHLEGMPFNKGGKVQTGPNGEYYPFPGDSEDGTIYEIAVDGPIFHHLKDISWRLQSKVQILITVPIGSDLYRIDRESGLLTHCFTQVIPIFQLGPDGIDTGNQIGCIHLSDDSRTIAVSNLGPVELGVESYQLMITGHYVGDFILPSL